MPDIILKNVCKSFGEKPVLTGLDLRFRAGGVYGLMGPSGRGKTTLLRLLAGLEVPDSGTIQGLEGLRRGMVFQENRLLEFADPVKNVLFAAPKGVQRRDAEEHLRTVLPDADLSLPVRTCSGGMKRRVALVRAVLPPSDLLLLDEPFTGLDEGTRQSARDYLLRHRGGRTMIFATHDREDLTSLGGIPVILGGPEDDSSVQTEEPV